MSLYENIHKKRARIKAGSGEKMRGKNDPKRPTAKDFKNAAKTAKKKPSRASKKRG
jgi:hypothetical protein